MSYQCVPIASGTKEVDARRVHAATTETHVKAKFEVELLLRCVHSLQLYGNLLLGLLVYAQKDLAKTTTSNPFLDDVR